MATNIFGEELKTCGKKPLTGFYRDGSCYTGAEDRGMHTVCAVVTREFLDFTRQRGNDLETPRPAFQFEGLKPGDRWCLAAIRWKEAYEAGKAPPVDLEATDEETLNYIPLDVLVQYAYKTK